MEELHISKVALDKILTRFDYNDERRLKLEEKVERLNQRLTESIDRVDTRLGDHERESSTRFNRLEENVQENHDELKALLKQAIDRLTRLQPIPQ